MDSEKKAFEARGAEAAAKRAGGELEKVEIALEEAKGEALEANRKAAVEEAAQEQAAAALANLARDSSDNRTSIVDAGGIPPLLALLGSSSAQVPIYTPTPGGCS